MIHPCALPSPAALVCRDAHRYMQELQMVVHQLYSPPGWQVLRLAAWVLVAVGGFLGLAFVTDAVLVSRLLGSLGWLVQRFGARAVAWTALAAAGLGSWLALLWLTRRARDRQGCMQLGS